MPFPTGIAVGALPLRPMAMIDADAPVQAAARLLADRDAVAAIVVRGGEPVGLVTGHDLAVAVLAHGGDAQGRVGAIAREIPPALSPSDRVADALAVLEAASGRPVPVRDDGRFLGVLDPVAVLIAGGDRPDRLAVRIGRARTIEDLRAIAAEIPKAVRALHDAGLGVTALARCVSWLNTRLAARLYTLLMPPEVLAGSCLMVMGSEARGEQLFKTDQDNGVILRDGFESRDFPALAATFTDLLVEFGYPECPGGIMVGRPAWTRTASAYRDAIIAWLTGGDEAGALDLAIFLDAVAIAGDARLLADLKRTLFDRQTGDDAFLARFARPALEFDTPLGPFSSLRARRGREGREVDIKKGGLFTIVHGVRSFALEYRLDAVGTMERLRTLTEARHFDERLARDLRDAFILLLDLRLRAHLGAADGGSGRSGVVDPDRLGTLDRAALKAAFRTVNRFKDVIAYHFRTRMF